MIDLEDFSPFLEVGRQGEAEEKEKPRERSVEEVEALYREKLLKLQARFKSELEKARDEAYRKGLKEGAERVRLELEAEFKKLLEKKEREYEKELSRLKVNLDELLSKFEEESRKTVKDFLRSVSDSLVELLEFLYISPENAIFVKESLEKLLSTFSTEDLISVEVGKELGKVVNGKSIKISEDLGENDFRLVFKEFTLESKLKDKLKLLREELEREAKKLT